jgi:hypothetical protein
MSIISSRFFLRYSRAIIALTLALASSLTGQITQFPYVQNFDGVTPPALPLGWATTTNRSPTGDFKTISTTVRSAPNAVIDSNSTISQSLISPLFNFSNRVVDSVEFWERRTSAHNSGILIEASVDGGVTFSVPVSDTLNNPGTTNYVRRAFSLPVALNNQFSVKLRWRVVGNGTGGSNTTIRFDDIRVTVKTQFDAGVTAVGFTPLLPVTGDSVLVVARVKNFGIQPVQNLLVEFFNDVNRDSIPQTLELFDSVRILQTIPAGDSTTASTTIRNLTFGERQIIVKTRLPDDEVPSNDQRVALLSVGVPRFSIVVNEVMYGPTSPEPEWVEIVNASQDTVNLRQWKVSDRNTASRATITSSDFYVAPGAFAVVAKDSTALMTAHPAMPARVFHVPALATLNNDSDAVVLFDNRGAVVDSIHYRSSWGGTLGRSLERIDARGSSLIQSNWGSSTHPARSTPGRKNSITPKDYDVAVSTVRFLPTVPVVGDSVFVLATVKNVGQLPASSILVEFFEDVDGDSLPQLQERFAMQWISQLSPEDSVILSAQSSSLALGDHLFMVRVEFTADEDTLNNLRRASVGAGYPHGTVVINEIMYAPTGGEPEWVEILNMHADSLNLKNWKISNRNSSTRYTIISSDAVVPRNDYVVITKDTALLHATHPTVPSTVIQAPSMPTFLFNNNGDAVVLFDSRNTVMDSVFYSTSWGGTSGRSLERIDGLIASNDSANWSSSQDSAGSTPGRQNTLTPAEFDLRALRIGSTFSGTDLRVHAVVFNVGREPASVFSVALFHDLNSDSIGQASELLERRSVAGVLQPRDSATVEFTWSDPGHGRKLLIAEVDFPQDLRPANNVVLGSIRLGYPPETLIINEIMHAPLAGQAEYVELYNRSQITVDLRDWKIADMRNTAGQANEFLIAKNRYEMQPGSYAVISSDTTILQRFALTPDSANGIHVFIMNRSNLSLNNDVDDVVLSDLVGSPIDSLRYGSQWHNNQIADATGRALERINPELPSTDRRNWSTSAHFLGGTPGRQNSIFTASVPTSTSLSFFPNPFSPDGDGHEDHTLVSYEVPATSALLRIRIFDAKGRSVRTLVNGEPAGARGSVVWDGMNDGRDKVRMGMYIVLLEALDASGSTIHSTKGVVVVAAKL